MSLTVSIFTPEKHVLQRTVESVVVPAADGELGILKNHLPLVAALQTGQIRLEPGADVFAVSGGFVEVKNNHVSIFAETAESAGDIDIERARQAAERARVALHSPRRETNLVAAETALRRALARLRAVEGIRRRQSPAAR